MPGITYEEQTAIRVAVKKYLKKHGMTSLRTIVDYVKQETGIETTPATISRLVQAAGYRVRSMWEKQEEQEE